MEVSNNGGAGWHYGIWSCIRSRGHEIGRSIQWILAQRLPNFRIRFLLTLMSPLNILDCYIDDISISYVEGAEIPCVADPGGLVVGNVYDDNTDLPLVGALVTMDTGASYVTVETPADPNVDDGFYTLFGSAGSHVLTASMDGYGDDVETVDVILGGTVGQDFFLGTGFLDWDPDSIHVTLDLGATADETLNLMNLGSAQLFFEISEMDRGFVPAMQLSIPRFTGTVAPDIAPSSTGRAPQSGVSGSSTPLAFPLMGEPAFAIDVYPGYNLVNIPDTTTPGVWNIIGGLPGSQYFAGDFINGDFSTLYAIDYGYNQLHAIDTATGAVTVVGPSVPGGGESWTGMTGATDGTMYASASACGATSTLYTIDLDDGTATPVGPILSGSCVIDIAINPAGEMYAVDIVSDVLLQIDPATGAGTVVGLLGVNANYAQGMDFEDTTGILYWAAYVASGELRIIDTTTGASTLVGGFPSGAEVDALAFATGGGGPDVPWLSEEPISGTIQAADTLPVIVSFDSTVVNQPGDYYADLKVSTDTPYGGATVPVTMTVLAPSTWGKLDGTVTDLCTGVLLEDVFVDIPSRCSYHTNDDE